MPRRTARTRRPASAAAASLAAAAQGQAVIEGQDNTGATARAGIFTTGNSEWTVLSAVGQEFLHHGGASRLGQTLQLHRERSVPGQAHQGQRRGVVPARVPRRPRQDPNGPDFVDVYGVRFHPIAITTRLFSVHVFFRPGDTSFTITSTHHVERSGRLLLSSSYRWAEDEGPGDSSYVSRVDECPST